MIQPADQPRRQPIVLVNFSEPDRRYQPRQSLTVRYTVDVADRSELRAVERSVLWYTEGKGDEDIGVHSFERVAVGAGGSCDGQFGCQLPTSPLSYEGLIVKIRWCVRVRLFFTAGRDFVSEHVFDLGDVPAAAFPGPDGQ
jgi:hypothetical protein